MSSGETAVTVILRPSFAKIWRLVLWAYIWKLIHLLISANLLLNVSVYRRFYATVRTELQTLQRASKPFFNKGKKNPYVAAVSFFLPFWILCLHLCAVQTEEREHCYQKAISVEWSGEQGHRKMAVWQMDVWESRQTLHCLSDGVTYFANTFG